MRSLPKSPTTSVHEASFPQRQDERGDQLLMGLSLGRCSAESSLAFGGLQLHCPAFVVGDTLRRHSDVDRKREGAQQSVLDRSMGQSLEAMISCGSRPSARFAGKVSTHSSKRFRYLSLS